MEPTGLMLLRSIVELIRLFMRSCSSCALYTRDASLLSHHCSSTWSHIAIPVGSQSIAKLTVLEPTRPADHAQIVFDQPSGAPA